MRDADTLRLLTEDTRHAIACRATMLSTLLIYPMICISTPGPDNRAVGHPDRPRSHGIKMSVECGQLVHEVTCQRCARYTLRSATCEHGDRSSILTYSRPAVLTASFERLGALNDTGLLFPEFICQGRHCPVQAAAETYVRLCTESDLTDQFLNSGREPLSQLSVHFPLRIGS